MRILVTGGAGYIGSVVVEQLLAEGEAVVVFDDLSQGHREAVAPAATFVEGTLADRAAIDRVMAEHRPEAVMHFASHTLVGESMQRPFLYLGENVVNGLNLLQCMVEHQVGRFILSSTANLFDDPEQMPITEAERIVPGSPYGESKYILERMLHWLGRIHGLRYAALRYFNAAGASPEHGEDHDPELHLIPIVLDVALGRRKEITIFGDDYPTPDGTCVRDYIHVLDLAQAHILALRALDGGGYRLQATGLRDDSKATSPPSAALAPSPSTGEGRGEGEESPSEHPPASPSPPTPLPPGARGANPPSPSTGEGRGEGEESPSEHPSRMPLTPNPSPARGEGSSLIYNLGNGQGFSVREVIDTARRITGHPIPARVGPRRAGDPAILVADSAKIRRELGWSPRYPELSTIIETAWRWHRVRFGKA
jgi:UDP-glucose 4-epimerase